MTEPKSEVFNMDINKIYNEDCLETLKRMPNEFIDLTVTSPPYDNLRKYNGYSFDFENIAKELYRVTKLGGVVVWVVGDATIDGSETGTSFRQALFFKECGFNLHDTMIFKKKNPMPQNHKRLDQCFEYIFCFSKKKPNTFNPIMEDTITFGTTINRNLEKKASIDNKSISRKRDEKTTVKSKKYKTNILEYAVGIEPEHETDKHPAIFPEILVKDQIYIWSNEGDLVYDPFMGSGTTGKMASLMNRNYLGSEISKEYFNKAIKRIELHKSQLKMF